MPAASKPQTYYGFKLDSKGRFNGKPLEHWNKQADKLLMQCLISASNVDTRSLVGRIVSDRIILLAQAIDPDGYRETLQEIRRMQANMHLLVASMMAEPRSLYCKKHQPKPTKRKRSKKKKDNRVDPLD
jgi:hypothetical protein